jgi:hypothetical protein
VLAEDAPTKASDRAQNTLYAGRDGGLLQSIIRIYLADQGSDGAGWGPSDSSAPGSSFPTYEGRLADGTKLTQAEVIEQFVVPMHGNTKQPITDEQWEMLLSAKDNDPALQPATTPARKDPKWKKYWNIKYSILGALKTRPGFPMAARRTGAAIRRPSTC